MDIGISMRRSIFLLGRALRGAQFLFQNNEPGLWLDASDSSTLSQDTAGTIPVTAPGQTVGLVLDKSQGLVLGPELVTNGTFDSDLTGWNVGTDGAGWSATGGRAYFNDTERAGNQFILQNVGATVGKSYEVTFEYEVTTGSFSFGFAFSSTAGGRFQTGTGSKRFLFTVTDSRDTGPVFYPENINSLCQFTVDNISVRELPGNHATQATAASRPTYGVVPEGGRRNLLTHTEAFDNAVWVKNNVTVTANTAIAPNGTMTADSFSSSAESTNCFLLNNSASGLVNSVYLKRVNSDWIALSNNLFFAYFNLSTGAAGSVGSGTSAIEDVGEGWFRVSWAAADGAGALRIRAAAGDGNNTAVIGQEYLVWGAQNETGATATPYQRVGTQFDVTEAGVPSVNYLRFDLSDDTLAHRFPNGFNGDVMLFGTNGSWIDKNISIAAGAALNIGPQAVTGGTAGVMAALGNILGWLPMGKSLSDAEQKYLVDYYKERGAKGLLVEGPELVLNGGFDTDTTGWGAFDQASLAVVDGTLEVTGNGGFNDIARQNIPTTIGDIYLFSASHKAGTQRSQVRTVSNTGTLFNDQANTTQSFLSFKAVFTATTTVTRLELVVSSVGAGTSYFDDISFRRLIPQEEL